MRRRLLTVALYALGFCLVVTAGGGTGVRGATAPEDAFQYRVVSVTETAPGNYPVVTFEVFNPLNGNVRYDIKTDPPFTSTADGASRLFVQIAWDTREYNNTGSGSEKTPVGGAPALPIGINALTAAWDVGGLLYQVRSPRPLPLSAKGSGTVAIEGHPAIDVNGDGVLDRLPVKSVYRHFAITDATVVARRATVDIEKCKRCHQPHLSLHGNNRTDEIQVCVTCHNPNATDIAYRTSGPETPIDFKRMVHAIHAGGMRQTPFVVIGRNGSINDFSGVRFPGKLNECFTCHISGKYGLPLTPGTLATTVWTGSAYGTPKVLDADPANDRNITPIAAVCSACHDNSKARAHMVGTGGASFSALQSDIDAGRVAERCVRCHGPGKDKDVLRVHEHEDGSGY